MWAGTSRRSWFRQWRADSVLASGGVGRGRTAPSRRRPRASPQHRLHGGRRHEHGRADAGRPVLTARPRAGTTWWSLAGAGDVSRGWLDMRSLDALVTDSAAASSSWGSGSRVCNGSINVLPDGTRLTPLAAVARDARRRVGLVTTTTVTHATPAGFAACAPERNSEESIAAQYLGRVDVGARGGAEVLRSGDTSGPARPLAEFASQGYRTWTTRDQLLARGRHERAPGPVLGHAPAVLHRPGSTTRH